MPIEVTSLPEQRSSGLGRPHFRDAIHRLAGHSRRSPTFQAVSAVILLVLTFSADALVRSYKFHSRLIDARLASGYLTSRPGLYAAPRTLRVGQGYSQTELVAVMKRAGYIEAAASDVWNGGFSSQGSRIDIYPRRATKSKRPKVVSVAFENERIAKLTGDDANLEYYTLQPEVLSNDLSSKTGKRNALSYQEIPPVLVQAILSIEDRRFFDHPGLDVIGVARALLRNAGDERIGQGGSTITQQLIKNTYLSPERSIQRKYAETMLAFALERRLSKQDIFALYCNEIYLGQRGAVTARGVEQAALIYFGKDLKQISLSEAATIAGMIQAPAYYSPVRHPEAARSRRNLVLSAMVRDGRISAEQAKQASNEAISLVTPSDQSASVAPYFIDYVNQVAESQFQASGETAQIHTTIDLDLQKLAEQSVAHQLNRLRTYGKGVAKPQAALVALDPRTGNVLAMVGGRDYGESQLNRATDARRQPGSTFKPFVYAAALEDGFSPVRMFSDTPRDFTYDRTRIYHPSNFGGSYSGRDVTMRTGLIKSLNTVTVDVAMQTGLARVANLASDFGLPKPQRFPSLALGTTEATPLQLAAAYAVFANGGYRVVPKVITGVAEAPAAHLMSEERQLISSTTAYMITNMLTAVVDEGTGRAARGAVKGTAIAGKTGTSRDAWFVGFTPKLVCVVWIGFDDNSQLGLTGAAAALPAWIEFVQGAVDLRPELGARNFDCPEGIKFVEIDNDSGLISTLSCPNRQLIAITDRLAPHTECYNHGNLPHLDDSYQKENYVRAESEVAQHIRSSPKQQTYSPNLRTTTRIDVDSKGRRTLVNELR